MHAGLDCQRDGCARGAGMDHGSHVAQRASTSRGTIEFGMVPCFSTPNVSGSMTLPIQALTWVITKQDLSS
eukprot:3192802-Amphidinium_carterae.1